MNLKNKNNFPLVFIIFLTSFIIWILFTLQLDKILNNWLLKSFNYYNTEISWDLNLDKYYAVYNLIKREYFDTNTINNEKILEYSIKWLVDWLWDRHSNYLNKEENISFTDSLSWDFEWIWAVIELHPLWVIIDRIIKWSPARKYDLRAWDVLISANWISLEWLSLIEAVNNIKWKAGTVVELEVIRPWEKNILIKNVVRDKIKIPSVDYKLLENNTWYISLNMFWEETSKDFESALIDLKDTDWIIIDLRDNWWWFLFSAVEILSKFIKSGEPLVITKYRDNKENDVYESFNYWNIYDWKIVVIINENSASASEILAWTLRDYNKAIVVWKKSYWKWSVQKPFDLPDWSMVKLTIAKWFTPKWTNIDKEWIVPDIEIWFLEEDYENLYDRQKEEAKNVLDVFIKNDLFQFSIDKYKSSIESWENDTENLD
jgi:carboxyl-terminal processing protease